MSLLKKQIVVFLLFCPFISQTQVLDFVDIHLTIYEKVGDKTRALPNAKLNISDQGEVITNDNGSHTYTYALRNKVNPEISISLLSDKHKMLKPLDGAIMVDPSKDEMFIEFVVVNMAEESPAFKKRVKDLETKISKLQYKNQLTKRQLSRLHTTLLDTIFYYEGIQSALEAELLSAQQVNEEQQEINEEQRTMIQEQQAKIRDLESQVDQLTADLGEALEARYLRQNEYFKNISSNLMAYLRKSKDIKDHLPNIKTYYGTPGGFKGLERDLDQYNTAYSTLDDEHLSYLEGVGHYWENKAISKELEEVFELVIKGLHLNQIFPVVNNVLDQLRKQKPGKAQKAATVAYEDLTINITDLEQKVNRILIKLRNN